MLLKLISILHHSTSALFTLCMLFVTLTYAIWFFSLFCNIPLASSTFPSLCFPYHLHPGTDSVSIPTVDARQPQYPIETALQGSIPLQILEAERVIWSVIPYSSLLNKYQFETKLSYLTNKLWGFYWCFCDLQSCLHSSVVALHYKENTHCAHQRFTIEGPFSYQSLAAQTNHLFPFQSAVSKLQHVQGELNSTLQNINCLHDII